DGHAVLRSMVHWSQWRHNRPPDACRPAYPPGKSQPPHVLPGVPTTVLQSLPIQCGTRAPSPENRSAPETRCSHLPATVPNLLSGTSALLHLTNPTQMGPEQTSRP